MQFGLGITGCGLGAGAGSVPPDGKTFGMGVTGCGFTGTGLIGSRLVLLFLEFSLSPSGP